MSNLFNQQSNTVFVLLSWCALAVFSRLIPHPPNATAMTCVALLACWHLTRAQSIFVVIVSLFVSDSVLAFLHGYPLFGIWSLFTYSAYLFIVLLLPIFSCRSGLNNFYIIPSPACGRGLGRGSYHQPTLILQTTIFSSLLFWLWTNFGVWLTSSYYPHSLNGLLLCYYMALPFLKNSILGNLMWMMGILILQLLTIKKQCKNSIEIFYQNAY